MKDLDQDAKNIIRKLHNQNAAKWARADLDYDDLLQFAREKIWELEQAGQLGGKGPGYQIQAIKNDIKNRLRSIDRHPEQLPGEFERRQAKFANEQAAKGLPWKWIFDLTDQEKRGLGWRSKYDLDKVRVWYDRKRPRKGHKCFAYNQWMIGDLLDNKKPCEITYDKEKARKHITKRLLRKLREEERPSFMVEDLIERVHEWRENNKKNS